MTDHGDVGDFDGQDLGAYVAKVRERDQHHGKAEAIRLARWVLTEATKRGLRQHAIDRLGPYAVMIGAAPAPASRYGDRWQAESGSLHVDHQKQQEARQRRSVARETTIEPATDNRNELQRAFIDEMNAKLNGR